MLDAQGPAWWMWLERRTRGLTLPPAKFFTERSEEGKAIGWTGKLNNCLVQFKMTQIEANHQSILSLYHAGSCFTYSELELKYLCGLKLVLRY